MTEIPQAVRDCAVEPFLRLPIGPGWRRVAGEHCVVTTHPMPIAQVVTPTTTLTPADVPAAVEFARAVVRERGLGMLIWLVREQSEPVIGALEEMGLVNEDTPGFEAVENAMALMQAPVGGAPADVQIVEVDTYEQFVSGQRTMASAFEFTPEMVAELEAQMQSEYEAFKTPQNPMHTLLALIDGRAVGVAGALVADVCINLLGGGVLQDARGRGVYRALTLARWQIAAELGICALTVQAGRMSRPPLERLGFQFIEPMRVYVDSFGTG